MIRVMAYRPDGDGETLVAFAPTVKEGAGRIRNRLKKLPHDLEISIKSGNFSVRLVQLLCAMRLLKEMALSGV